MAEKIYFAGGKGGTGATTVCVGLGLALAGKGEKTLLADGDSAAACAMTVAGMGNMQTYTLADYEKAACRAKQTATPHPKCDKFYIMPSLGLKSRSAALKALGETEGLFDYVLLDGICPQAADRAVVVTEPYLPSIKGADYTAGVLADAGIKDISLIVNKLNGGQVLGGEVYGAEQIAEILRLPLLAAIPEDATIATGKWQKRTVNAFACAADALTGKSPRPFDVFKGYSGLNGFIRRRMREMI